MRLITLPMPEGGEEHSALWTANHNCKNAKWFRAAMEDDGVDMVLFPVGLVGYGMPSYTPFVVESTNPCGVCGTYLRSWFQWSAPGVIAL